MMKLFSDLAALRGSLVFVRSEELFIFFVEIQHVNCSHLVAALLRVAGVTAGLAESNGSLLPGL